MIAVFDSGLGGLSVLREMLSDFSNEAVVYAADRGNAPYGPRSLEEVRRLTHRNVGTLIARGATTIVLACNTASAAALDSLRASYPDVAFVGMEPALKPAASLTRSGIVVVVATAATFQGRLFASLVDRYSEGLQVVTEAAPEWVDLVEAGVVGGADARRAVAGRLQPLLDEGADTVVLGCTHFTFLTGVIRDVAGDRIAVVDPAAAVARRARQVHLRRDSVGSLQAMVSGDAAQFAELSKTVAGVSFPNGVLPL